MRSVKILLLSHEMTYTGAPNSLLSMARVLRENGFSVTVYTLKHGAFEREFKKNGFKVGIACVDNFLYNTLPENFDAVITNTIFTAEFALKAQEYINTYLYIREAENIGELIEKCDIRKDCISAAKNVICVSEYAENYIRENFAPKNLNVIHNFLYEEKYKKPDPNTVDGKVNFLIAATIEERKGISIALEAMELLGDDRNKITLHIAGSKPDWAQDYWSRLSLENAKSVIYHGEITDRSEMDRLYETANVIIVPSYDESCSLTALEGAKHGKAIIVTENVGAKYIVNKNGRIVKTGSPNELAEAIRYFIDNSSELVKMGERSFENFIETSTKDIYIESFKSTVKADGREINVCFIADDDYVKPTLTAIASLCLNAKKTTFFNIYIVIPKGCTRESKRYLEKSAFDFENAEVEIVECALGELAELHKSTDTRYLSATSTALLKFRLGSIFSKLDKILYLDGDIIVRDDLWELYSIDISNYYVAAARDLPQVLYDDQTLGAEISGQDYFNSGVMLLNLNKMRENNAEELLIETKKSYPDGSLMDQNILNIVFKGAVLQLPFVYNCCYTNLIESKGRYDINKLNEMYSTSYKTAYEILPDIKIMHFSSKLKPWYFYDVPLADEWIFYYKKSLMRNVKLQRTFHTERNVDMSSVKKTAENLSKIDLCGFRRLIPVVFAGNEEYITYAITTVHSIYKNSNPTILYEINILVDSSMSENMKMRLRSVKYSNIRIVLWDVRNCFNGIDLYSVGHYSKQMYYRWLIPEILSMYDKVIYLDCDTVVNKDIAALYDIGIGKNYIAATSNFVRDNLNNHIQNRLGLKLSEYYNSGVLAINCSQWISKKLKVKCIECLSSYDKLVCPDQDVLNVICKGKILKLDDRWNFQWHHMFPEAVSGNLVLDFDARYEKLKNSVPWIVHYTSFVKPWKSPEKAFSEYFWVYCRETIFYEHILLTRTRAEAEELWKNAEKKWKDAEEIKKNSSKRAAELRWQIEDIHRSFTYKLSRVISWLPRKLRGYDYTLLPGSEVSADEQIHSLNNGLSEIYNSKSFKLARKLTALPRKLRSMIKKQP